MDSNELEKAKHIIFTTDLQNVIERLVKIENWSLSDAENAVKQYRNYLFLKKKYPEHNLPPSKDIDEVWHAHVLHTADYRTFCKQVFHDRDDQYLDHHPHVAKEGNFTRLNDLFEETQALYYQEFGDYIYQITGRTYMRKLLDKTYEFLSCKFGTLTSDL